METAIVYWGYKEARLELTISPLRNLLPYLVELCGPGYRMDHLPLVITSQKGSEGFHLHGGPLTQALHLPVAMQS